MIYNSFNLKQITIRKGICLHRQIHKQFEIYKVAILGQCIPKYIQLNPQKCL